MSDLLKSVLQDLINDRTEQAQVSIHQYIVGKTQQVAGLSEGTNEARAAADKIAAYINSAKLYGPQDSEVVEKKGYFWVDFAMISGMKSDHGAVEVRSPSDITIKWHGSNPLGTENKAGETMPAKGSKKFSSVEAAVKFIKLAFKEGKYKDALSLS